MLTKCVLAYDKTADDLSHLVAQVCLECVAVCIIIYVYVYRVAKTHRIP